MVDVFTARMNHKLPVFCFTSPRPHGLEGRYFPTPGGPPGSLCLSSIHPDLVSHQLSIDVQRFIDDCGGSSGHIESGL